MKTLKIHFILTLILFTFLLMGCLHAPGSFRPDHWVNHRIDVKSVADNPNQSLLQVIIVYGPWWCHHSALRLVSPDQRFCFETLEVPMVLSISLEVRSKDLIRIDPPDLETYLQFAWRYSSVEVEVFEWDMSPKDAQELYDILIRGTDKTHPAGKFSTITMGGFCSVNLSDFLRRFAGKKMVVPKSYFCPHNLARVLYTQSPRRVLVFRRDKQIMYVPSGIPSARP